VFFYFIAAEKSFKKISISRENIDLAEFLNIVGEHFDVQFFLTIKSPICLRNISFSDINLKALLDALCKSFNLTYNIENNCVYIKNSEDFWVSYPVKFFCEDNLSNLSSFFDDKRTSSGEQISIFWQEVEKNIKQISNNNFSIDKYNGIINVFGNQKAHKEISEYLQKITKSLYQQVLIECKVLEVSSEVSQLIDLFPLLSLIQDKFSMASLASCVQGFANECRKLYKNAQIKTSTDIYIRLMSQHTGRILSSKIDFFQEQEVLPIRVQKKNSRHQFSNNNDFLDYKNAVGTYYEKNEHGFSLTVVPLILDDQTVLLKLRPSISTLQKEDQEKFSNQPQNIQRREFNTVIRTISEKNHVLGGLYIEYDIEEIDEATRIPLLRSIFNKKRKIRKKSYFVLFIKVTIC
jgi:type II secretory pathway component GspD/PulD (secretin)